MSDVNVSAALAKQQVSLWPSGESLDLRNLLGPLAYKELELRTSLPAVHAVFSKSSLSPGEQANLFSLPLPLLLKCVEVHRQINPGGAPTRVRPLLYLRLVPTIEEKGVRNGIERCVEEIVANLARVSTESQLSIAIDRWRGVTKLSSTLDALMEIGAHPDLKGRIEFLGPSTADVRENVPRQSEGDERTEAIKAVLAQLKAARIETIEGGSDLEIHKLAAEQRFLLSFAYVMTPNQKAPAATVSSSRIRMNNLVSQFTKLRATLHDSGQLQTLFPWTPTLLRRNVNAPTLTDVLRFVAIARLFFPRTAYIKAPLAITGSIYADVALSFGANDLGFVAVNAKTAEDCGLPLLSEMQSVFPAKNGGSNE